MVTKGSRESTSESVATTKHKPLAGMSDSTRQQRLDAENLPLQLFSQMFLFPAFTQARKRINTQVRPQHRDLFYF